MIRKGPFRSVEARSIINELAERYLVVKTIYNDSTDIDEKKRYLTRISELEGFAECIGINLIQWAKEMSE